MKKLLMGSLALAIAAIAISAIETSCQKSVAQSNSSSSSSQLMLYRKPIATPQTDSAGNVIGYQVLNYDYFISDIDGSNARQIFFTLPEGVTMYGDPFLSADGQTIIFNGHRETEGSCPVCFNDIYSVSVDGTNMHKIASDVAVKDIN